MAYIGDTGGSIIRGNHPDAGFNYIFKTTGAPVNGTSGTFAGSAPVGAILQRTDTDAYYKNVNTVASPTWSLLSV